MAHQRRPHQREAISNVLSGFRKSDRGQLIKACGTGKTVVCLWIKEDLDSQRTLVLVPTLSLLDQYAGEWRRHQSLDQPYATLCVCSDNTVGQRSDESYDELRFSKEDLQQEGFDVTSNPQRIAAFLKEKGRRVIFSTYQSSHLLAEAQEDHTVPAFDLAIADEGHRCAGNLQSVFATILDDERIRAHKRLFTTATPRIYRRTKGKKETTEDILVDMNNEALFGPRFHTLSFGEAIRRDLLSDYKVVIMMVDDPAIHTVLQSSDDQDRAERAAQVGLLKTIKEYGLQRVISFHSYVKSAYEFARALPVVAKALEHEEIAIPESDYVSGEMSALKRKQKMNSFRNSENGVAHVLSNARCLTEGVDVPDIDGIAFIDPRRSHIDIIQALGRAIRKHDRKDYGVIILPVYLGQGETAAEVIENSNFNVVWEVLNALRSHDADFDTALKQKRQEEGGTDSGGDPFTKIQIVGTRHVAELAEALRPRMIEELTDHWEVGFGALRAYQLSEGDCLVAKGARWPKDDPQGFPLGSWVSSRRTDRKAGKLSEERIARLEALGFVWDPLDAKFEEGFAYLKAYQLSEGDCLVPSASRWPKDDPQGFPLGEWVRSRRTDRKADRLLAEREARLNEMGFVWETGAVSREPPSHSEPALDDLAEHQKSKDEIASIPDYGCIPEKPRLSLDANSHDKNWASSGKSPGPSPRLKM